MRKNYYLTTLLTLLIAFGGMRSMKAQISTFPYLETFGNSGCALPTGYTNTGSDPWDFQNTSETYMEGLDHTSNGGCFASMDDSGGSVDDSCLLETPTFDLTSIPGAELRFWWQNSNSTTSSASTTGPRTWSELAVDISTNGGTSWTRNVWVVTDSQQIGWAEGVVDLSSYISSNTKIRFRGTETWSFRSDLALDDILIFEPKQWDAEATVINSPLQGGCGISAATVEFELKNNGFDTIQTIFVSYQLNNGTVETDTIASQILPNASYIHAFNTPVALTTPGTNTLKVWTDLALDSTFTNDTLSVPVVVAPTVTEYPYYEDFEAGVGGWQISGVNSSWDFGTPAKSIINSASSGVNCFVNGGLTGTYNVNENSEITGPCFDFTSPMNQLWVSLDIWYDAETSWDGAVLQFSLDSGSTWHVVGADGDPYNWYTDNTINGDPGGQQEGWTGTGSSGSLGWLHAKHELPDSLKGEDLVLFRIAFGSDGSIVDNGVAIDNFAIVDYSGVEFDLEQQSLCGTGSTTLYSNVTSWGNTLWSDSSTNDSLVVSTQGQYWVTFTDTILDFTTSDSIDIIVSDPPQIAFASTIDTISINGQITLDPNLPFDLDYLWTPGNYTFPYLLVKGSDVGLGSHDFTLLVTDSLSCTDEQTVTVVVDQFIGIDEMEQFTMSLFPNPVEDVLNIQFSGEVNENMVIEVMNSNGQVVSTLTDLSGAKGQFSVDLSGQTPGLYFVKLMLNDQSNVVKFVKK